ncbi:MAG: hypothetical protein KBG20_07565 [Caldilineaceae bacterium]|nr:hypothetical protein [Caldilineaceae bacterium]MBP8106919.1 hypothetical protein [Caldilineaceae bacterium]MBP8121839.1 hypothetical protein [Caldilineaceae bacterium]MBP9072139.1 hypothetical protein [Caldilineaceae bacterium]
MEAIPNTAESWGWWLFTAIFVAVIINLISAFLYPRIEKKWAKTSEARSLTLKSKQQNFMKQVHMLASNSDRLAALKIDLILQYIRLIIIATMTIMILLVIDPFANIIAMYGFNPIFSLLVALFMALILGAYFLTGVTKTLSIEAILTEAEKQRMENLTNEAPKKHLNKYRLGKNNSLGKSDSESLVETENGE